MRTYRYLLPLMYTVTTALSASATYTGDSSIVHVSVDSVRVNLERPFKLSIQAESEQTVSIASYQLTLTYDEELITFDSLHVEGSLSEKALISVNEAHPGILYIAAAMTQSVSGPGALLHLQFSSRNLPGTSRIVLSDILFNEGLPEAHATTGVVHIETYEETRESVHLALEQIDVLQQESFEVALSLDFDHTTIYSGSITIQYNPDLLIVDSLNTKGTLLDIDNALIDYQVDDEGFIHIAFASVFPIEYASVPLILLKFESKDLAGRSPLSFVDIMMNEGSLETTFQDGEVIIQPDFISGDVNGDEIIAMEDPRLVLWHVLGRNKLDRRAQRAADVSANNRVSSYDAALILQHIFGILECFPSDDTCTGNNKHITYEDPGASSVTGTSFTWRSKHESASSTPEKLSLLFDGAGYIYSLDLILSFSRELLPDVALQRHLPSDWIVTIMKKGVSIQLSLAGSTPLAKGSLLTLYGYGKDQELTGSSIQINGQDAFDISPASSRSMSPTYSLDVFPNPFEQQTSITYSLSEAEKVEVKIYDILGRHIRSLALGNHESGFHTIRLDGTGLPAGLYVVQLNDEKGQREVKTVIKR